MVQHHQRLTDRRPSAIVEVKSGKLHRKLSIDIIKRDTYYWKSFINNKINNKIYDIFIKYLKINRKNHDYYKYNFLSSFCEIIGYIRMNKYIKIQEIIVWGEIFSHFVIVVSV